MAMAMEMDMAMACSPLLQSQSQSSHPDCKFKICLSEASGTDMDEVSHSHPDSHHPIEPSSSIPLTPLQPSQLSTLLSLLPPPLQEEEAHSFSNRELALPSPMAPPKPGTVVRRSPFPPPVASHLQPPSLHQQLSQYQEEEVFVERFNYSQTHISLTFSQPMIPLSNLTRHPHQYTPLPFLTLTPTTTAGQWRWIDVHILHFEPAHNHLPFSTLFSVSIEEGCKSALGGLLASSFSRTFSTPPPLLIHSSPSDSSSNISLSPLFFLSFNQRINPPAILSHIKLTSLSSSPFTGPDFEQVEEDIAKKEWPKLVTKEEEGKWVACRLKNKLLNKSTLYTLHVPAGCPSAEGPLLSTQDWSTSFTTYGPLLVKSTYPDSSYHPDPGINWTVQFSNPLDHSTVTKTAVEVSPSIQDLKVVHEQGSPFITLQQQPMQETTYLVTFNSSIRDIYGQSLDSTNNTALFTSGTPSAQSAWLFGAQGMVLMDPAVLHDPYFPVVVCNLSSLRIQVYQVAPDDWGSEEDLPHNTWKYARGLVSAKGKQVFDSLVEMDGERDQAHEHRIFLTSFLQHQEEHLGQLLVIVEPSEKAWMESHGRNSRMTYEYRNVVSAWIQCTHIAITVFPDHGNHLLIAWVTDLITGAPIGQAGVSYVGNTEQNTDMDGLASVKLDVGENAREKVVVVKKGKDICLVANVSPNFNDNNDLYKWCVFNDRGLYKPNETVHIKGYLRRLETRGKAHLPVFAHGHVKYCISDSCQNQIATAETPLNEYGAFFFTFCIPDNANLGSASIFFEYKEQGTTQRTSHMNSFRIEEFRKPEFEISCSHTPTSCLYSHPTHSNFVIVSTSAMYYSGGPLTGAEIRWAVHPKQTSYSPPGHSDYRFGKHSSSFFWCWGGRMPVKSGISYPSCGITGKTSRDGRHEVKVEYSGLEKCPSSVAVLARATVMDLNNQAQECSTTFLIHPAAYFVGYRLNMAYGKKGEEIKGKVIVCNVDGRLVSGVNVNLSVVGDGTEEDEDDAGLLVHKDVKDEQDITIVSEDRAAEFSFVPRIGGTYSLIFTVVDSENRCNQSSFAGFFVMGGYTGTKEQLQMNTVPQEEAQIVPNKDTYNAAEERAELLIVSPVWPAQGLLIASWRGRQVGEKVRFSMQAHTQTVTIPLDISWIPSLKVTVELVGSVTRSVVGAEPLQSEKPLRPAFAVGRTQLKISSSGRRLMVDINPKRADEVALPGQSIHVSVAVTDARFGKAVGGAEVTMIMVDDSALSLTGYTLEDPLSVFYPQLDFYERVFHSRNFCLLIGDENIKMPNHMNSYFSAQPAAKFCSMAFKGACLQSAEHGPNVIVRSDFNPLAAFVPSSMTDAQGQVELAVNLPDTLTRYRIWVIAATESYFGLGESSLTVRLPVMISPSPPRFLNFHDECYISVILKNQSDLALPLLVGARVTNAAMVDETHAGYSLTLPAAQRTVVTFPVLAVTVGLACLEFVVSTVNNKDIGPFFNDVAKVTVPVYTPAVSESFATYGDLADTLSVISQPVKCPSNAHLQFGGLDVSTSSTAVQSLTDAMLYLYEYPYECNEQIASRIIGIISLWNVLQDFHVKEVPSEEMMRSRLEADLIVLRNRQWSCGGWSWWAQKDGTHHEPYISLHVACSLVKAWQKKMVEVDGKMLANAMHYCANIESKIKEHPYSQYWSEVTKHALVAFALYIRSLANQWVGQEARSLLKTVTVNGLSMEACGWMLVAFSVKRELYEGEIGMLVGHIMAKVSETAEHANFTTGYKDDGVSIMLHSKVRTDAVLLEALLAVEPASPLCTKLAKGIQADCTSSGRWNSTQENCFVLSSLERFFSVYEKEQPDFTANIWLGEQLVLSHAYIGRSTETNQVRVPMPFLIAAEERKEAIELIIEREGRGRLYYRMGLVYAPRDLQLEAISYGFTVSRSYEGVDSPLHVTYDPDSALWKFKVGEKIKVTLNISTPVRRHHVALVDSVPAGCELLNPHLTGMKRAKQNRSPYKGWYSRLGWVEHENLRDERVEAYCSTLWPGVYEYLYVMRATCKGKFIVPPLRAEEMYSPENFGRSATTNLVIE